MKAVSGSVTVDRPSTRGDPLQREAPTEEVRPEDFGADRVKARLGPVALIWGEMCAGTWGCRAGRRLSQPCLGALLLLLRVFDFLFFSFFLFFVI